MRIIADLHIHSKYSRAVSPLMTLENLDAWADDKGVTVLGTGDFTHPAWMKEIKNKLEPAETGLFKLREKFSAEGGSSFGGKKPTMKGAFAATRFMLTVEISSIYSRGGKTRRVHNLIFAPNLDAALKINLALSKIGNIKSDGRPIIGIDSEDLLKLVLEIDEHCVLVPAHIWTPWFAMFGSMSGFDSIEECFGDYAKYIFAIETGLSSDPPMNWRVSNLDRVALISNSDAHSLERIGREANVLECELSYAGITEAIKNGSSKFTETIEINPEAGRYHLDGHRACGIIWTPNQTKQHKNICSKCGRKVTVGTLNRLAQIADRPENYIDKSRVPFRRLVPLAEIISATLGVGAKSKAVQKEYLKLILAFGSELKILLDITPEKISAVANPKISKSIAHVRLGQLKISPGYDGVYGKVML